MVWIICYSVVAFIVFVVTMVLFSFGESFTGTRTPLLHKIFTSLLFGIFWPITVPTMIYVALG